MPSIALLHGFLGQCDDWDDVCRHATSLRNARRIPLTILADAPTYDQAIDRLAGELLQSGAPVHLAGYSMGGRLALAVAIRYPDQIASLSLISSSAGLVSEAERASRRAADAMLADRLANEPLDRFLADWYRQPIFSSLEQKPTVRERMTEARMTIDPLLHAGLLRRVGTGMQPSYHEPLRSFSKPLLLLAGADDPKYAAIARELGGLCRHAEVAIIEAAGHALLIEQPEAVATHLESLICRSTEQQSAEK